MNAHQRRTYRRINARHWTNLVFDLESLSSRWGDLRHVSVLGDFFDSSPTGRTLTAVVPDTYCARRTLSGVANGIEPLSNTIKVLKARESAHNRVYDNLCANMDFTKLEDLAAASVEDHAMSGIYYAYGGCRSPGKSIDIHRQRAAVMFNVAYEDVTEEQRVKGKNANYIDWYKP